MKYGVFVILILVMATTIGCFESSDDDDSNDNGLIQPVTEGNLTVSWLLSIVNDSYKITFDEIGDYSLDALEFTLKDRTGWDFEFVDVHSKYQGNWNTSGIMEIAGSPSTALFKQWRYNAAKASEEEFSWFGQHFYYDSSVHNDTLFSIYVDEDNNNRTSNGDYFMLRTAAQGGPWAEGHKFKLKNGRNAQWASLTLPSIFPKNRQPKTTGDLVVEWSLKVINGDYRITIQEFEYRNLSNLECVLDDGFNRDYEFVDPSGEPIGPGDDLDSIVFNQTQYDIAHSSGKQYATWGDYFYSDSDWYNHTLYTVVVDTDSSNSLTSGDEIWLRSASNAGPWAEGHKFHIYQEDNRKWAKITLPSIEWSA